LRFTADEAAEFLRRMRLELSSADVAALHRRTEGWIAGLQLAALSLRSHDDVHQFVQSFTGSHRYVLDYLIEEVFKQQPAILIVSLRDPVKTSGAHNDTSNVTAQVRPPRSLTTVSPTANV